MTNRKQSTPREKGSKNEKKAFKTQLNAEQKEAKSIILDNDITIIIGEAGTGKSLLAAQVALDMLQQGMIEKVIVTRPVVTTDEDLGFLPGGIDEKLAPYVSAIYDNMISLTTSGRVEELLASGELEIRPLGFMRGSNFGKCLIILEEAQNTKKSQMKLLLTRLCGGSKLIMTGDADQIDLRPTSKSAYPGICEHLPTLDRVAKVELKINHRIPLVKNIIELYKEHSDL